MPFSGLGPMVYTCSLAFKETKYVVQSPQPTIGLHNSSVNLATTIGWIAEVTYTAALCRPPLAQIVMFAGLCQSAVLLGDL